jgi:hypothetical protein
VRTQLRILVVVLLSLAAIAIVALAEKRFYSSHSLVPAAAINVPPTQSYLLILGIADKVATKWDGSVTATGGTITALQGWRFTGTDAINGTTGWAMATRTAPAGPTATTGPFQENGVLITIAAPTTPVALNVQTLHGNFSFSTKDISFGSGATFLAGKAQVIQTGSPVQLTSSIEEEDFPVTAQSGDDVYLVYTRFVHGDRTKAAALSTRNTITDFSFLSRPTGGDQVFFMHYSKSAATWTGPFAVTNAGEDMMRTAVAIDGQGRAWIFYSAQRNGNFDIYARNAQADGSLSAEIRLTSDPGTDLYPVAATDAFGRVWIAWQGFRNNNLEVLTSVQNGNAFAPEAIVSTSRASDWDPAIAAAPDGEVAISWDTYDKGDYDVYLRRVRFTDQIGMDDPIAVAATNSFEARSSLAYDSQNRLWIAYEVANARWGKDFGAYDTAGNPLYSNHTIQVRCLIGNDLYTTTNDVATVLPGEPAAELFQPSTPGPFSTQPDPTLAQKRTPNNNAAIPPGPKNAFPRLATDSDGTVYLFFREPAGSGLSTSAATGQTVGSIWTGAMVYFDGAKWNGPGVLAHTDTVSDDRPSIVALGPGHLMVAQGSDHRLLPLPNGTPAADGTEADVFALDLPVSRTQQAPQLTRIGQVTPSPPDAQVPVEGAADTLAASYRPTVNGVPLQLLRGDFHRHSELSFDGGRDGPLIDSYRYFIDAAALNWVGCCDHDNGGAREYSWWMIQKFTDAYTLGTKFVPTYYYERSVNYPEGHRNIMFPVRGIRPLPRLPLSSTTASGPAPDTTMLYAYLHYFNALSAPHTSATDQGTDWRNNDPAVEPFVEIYQGDRQTYEMPGAPRSNTAADSISGYEAAGYVNNALGMGYILGFEASSDHISTHISYTNLWVTSPTRAGIMDAMHNRRMFGSTDNIVADFRSGQHFMGESFSVTSAPVFSVKLWGTAPFQTVVVVKDGNVVYSTSGPQAMSFTWQDPSAVKGKTSYYYVRGLQTDGNIVWVSPMWVSM